MNTCYVFLIALFCLPVVGLAQHDKGMNDGLRSIRPGGRLDVDSSLSVLKLKQPGVRVFDTYPMPNVYQGDYTVAMPNAYRGDNCVPMPNVYQSRPAERIIDVELDSVGDFTPDSLLLREYDKRRDTLEKRKPDE